MSTKTPDPTTPFDRAMASIVSDPGASPRAIALARELLAEDAHLNDWFADCVKGQRSNDDAEEIMSDWYDAEEGLVRAWAEHAQGPVKDWAALEVVLGNVAAALVALRQRPDRSEG